ncbi:MAG: hypothetical protein QM802_20110 [Agriterribacter sp.]
MNIPADYNQLKDLYIQQSKRLKAYIATGNRMRGYQKEVRKGILSMKERRDRAEREFDDMLKVDRKLIGIQETIFKPTSER